MAENKICSFLDADFRNDDRLIVKFVVGDNEAVIFGDSVAQTMPPLGVIDINFRPGGREKNLVMIAFEGLERLARRSSCGVL